MELQELVEKARHTKVRKKLLDLEIYRAVKTLADAGATPHDFAHGLGISKYELPDMLKKAERVEPIRAGFSSGSPYEICNATTLVNSPVPKQLMNSSVGNTSLKLKVRNGDPWGMEGGAPEVPGSWDDMNTAKTHKLIDYDLVLEVSRTRAALRRAAKRINPLERAPNYS